MKKLVLTVLVFSGVFSWAHCDAQNFAQNAPGGDSINTGIIPDTLNKDRLNMIYAAQGIFIAASMSGLFFIYYINDTPTRFRFFNDNKSWLQMDKFGHNFTSYTLSRNSYNALKWAGKEEKKSILYGSLSGFSYLFIMEMLDGFSHWGFSPGDIGANTAGSLLFAGQQLGWKEQRITAKYSFYPSGYSKYNPEILGRNFAENMVEDYNGMTLWLSGNISSFLHSETRFPKWLNIAAGYSGKGLAVNNTDFERYRQFYVSLDADLTRIPTHSKTLKGLFKILNAIKLPFPAIEYNTLGQYKFHYLYF